MCDGVQDWESRFNEIAAASPPFEKLMRLKVLAHCDRLLPTSLKVQLARDLRCESSRRRKNLPDYHPAACRVPPKHTTLRESIQSTATAL